jgi:hypothetical protein
MKAVLTITKAELDLWLKAKGHEEFAAGVLSIDAAGGLILTVEDKVPDLPVIPPVLPPVLPPVVPVPPVVPITAPSAKSTAFAKAFDFVIKWEGSTYEDVPGDPGGPTKYGIDQKDHPGVDIKNLTLSQAEDIYWNVYWLGSNCNNMKTPVAETHFNFSVNTGSSQSVKFMQRALGVNADGQFGTITSEALAKADQKKTALGMVDEADGFYHELATSKPTMQQFLAGWLNRNNDLRKFINSIA